MYCNVNFSQLQLCYALSEMTSTYGGRKSIVD